MNNYGGCVPEAESKVAEPASVNMIEPHWSMEVNRILTELSRLNKKDLTCVKRYLAKQGDVTCCDQCRAKNMLARILDELL